MEIKSKLTRRNGDVCDLVYIEGKDPNQGLNGAILHGSHACCFYNNRLVLVHVNKRNAWEPPGGAIEAGETWQEATAREVKEESNMRVLHMELIGYQDVFQTNEKVRQTRVMCIVEPYGDFVSDPDGDIDEIKLIEPKDYKQYFDWGEVGERIIERALELKKEYDTRTRLG